MIVRRPRNLSLTFAGLAVAGLALLGGAGCDRAKMTESHGRAYREAFARQIANPAAATKGQPGPVQQGLDSQEAAIVSNTYRKNLAPKADEPTRGQMLYNAPRNPQAERADLPPPSVPNSH